MVLLNFVCRFPTEAATQLMLALLSTKLSPIELLRVFQLVRRKNSHSRALFSALVSLHYYNVQYKLNVYLSCYISSFFLLMQQKRKLRKTFTFMRTRISNEWGFTFHQSLGVACQRSEKVFRSNKNCVQ